MRGAGDVASPAGPGADGVEGGMHGGEHLGMLTHAEIIVAAPDGDGPLRPPVMDARRRVGDLMAFDIGEDAVTSLVLDRSDRFRQFVRVIHASFGAPWLGQ